MRHATLLFLIKRENGEVSSVCLAMKKKRFGAGKWNGAGGKVEPGETVEEAAIRETKEEIGVEPRGITKVAELTFHHPHNPAFDQIVHAYISESWLGEPRESEEMRPEWFKAEEIPFSQMWADDKHWLPLVLEGKLVRADFSFDGDAMLDYKVEIVLSL